MPTSPEPIPVEILSPSEYALLTSAVSIAEHGHFAVTTYLAPDPNSISNVPLITLRPRPCFPPPLFDALIPVTITPPPRLVHKPLAFSLASHTNLSLILETYNLSLSIPSLLFNLLLHKNLAPPSKDLIERTLSPTPWRHLHEFQRTGVQRAIRELEGRVLLADDMGLGKTVQALCVAHYFHLRSKRPVLILCPPTLMDSWKQAVLRWLRVNIDSIFLVRTVTQWKKVNKMGSDILRDPWDSVADVRYVVTTYDLIAKVLEEHQETGGFEAVVADECHVMRNVITKRNRAATNMICMAKRRIMVSATPVLSRPMELYPILQCVMGDEDGEGFLSVEEFRNRYCSDEGKRLTYGTELNALLETVMVRRTKNEVEVEASMGKKERMHVIVEVEQNLLEPLQEMRDELDLVDRIRKGLAKGDRIDAGRRHQILCQSLRFQTALLKIPGVLARMTQLFRDGIGKMLVFAYHLDLLNAIELFATRERFGFIRIDGGIPVGRRQMLVDNFQDDASVRIGILSLQTAGTGLTLTAADIVLFAELSWVPADLVQAEDRAHRIGRRGDVRIEYVVAEKTVDELMWAALQSKLGIVNRTVDGEAEHRKKASDVCNQSMESAKLSCSEVQKIIEEGVIPRRNHQKAVKDERISAKREV